MAKKIKGAQIVLEVTSDGSLRIVEKEAKRASKGLDKVSKSAGDTRRNMQAMSGRVESGTKGFARMQQGTGGVVQAYAILASTLFAVGAAFRALEVASNIQNQIRGFEMLATVTGTAMLSITENVRAATGGLLDFQTAAQQTAIATAAGFSSSQIIQLAEGAKNASVALGRDLTDSFNRLIRGVTKAEPELLDELGVILRLDIATRNYAASVGASADKLTIAQRRTAVFNEVAKQLEDNFGAIAGKADQLLNPVTRFQTLLNDISITAGGLATGFFNPFLDFLERTPILLGGLLALIVKVLATQMVPALGDVTASLTNYAKKGQQDLKDLRTSYDLTQKKIDRLKKGTMNAEDKVSAAFKKSLKKRGMEEKVFFEKSAANQKRSISAYINNLKKQEAATGRSMARQIAIQKAAYKKISDSANATALTIAARFQLAFNSVERGVLRMGIIARGAFAGIAKSAIAAFGPAFRAIGAIFNMALGVFFAAFTVFFLEEFIPGVKEARKVSKQLSDAIDVGAKSLAQQSIVFNSFSQNILPTLNDQTLTFENNMKNAVKAVDFLANAFQNLGDDKSFENFQERLDKLFEVDGKQQEVSLSAGGSFKGFFNKDTYLGAAFQSQEARDAGALFMQSFLSEAQGTLQTDSFALQGALKQLFIGFDLSNEEVNSFVQQTMAGLTEIDKADNIKSAKKRTEDLLETIEGFGLDYRNLFEIDDDGFVKTNAFAEKLFQTLVGINKPVKEILTDIRDLDEPLKNFNEQLDLSQKKPTELGKIGNSFEAIFLQLQKLKNEDVEGLLNSLTEEEEKRLVIKGKTINLEDVAITKLMTQLSVTREYAKLLLDNNENIVEFFSTLDKVQRTTQTITSIRTAELNLMKQLNDRHSKRQVTETQIKFLKEDIAVADAKILQSATKLRNQDEAAKEAAASILETQQINTENLVAQKETMTAQLTILENQLDRMYQLRKTIIETFDQSAGAGLEQMILGESSGSEVAAKIAGDLQKATAGLLSDQLMTGVTGGLKSLLGMGEESIKLTPEAQAIQSVHNEHVEKLEKIMRAHAKAFNNDMDPIANQVDVTNVLGSNNPAVDAASAAKEAITSKFSSMFSSFTSGFGSFFSSIFGGGMGGLGSGLMSIFGLERGGVIGLAKGGMMPRYSDGGIATQPTYLVGEGKQNEAVVPLPDNRSIPVNLKGGGGTTNTNISVNIDQSGTSSTITSDDAGALGAMLDAAVQQTLERELRPGGILGG